MMSNDKKLEFAVIRDSKKHFTDMHKLKIKQITAFTINIIDHDVLVSIQLNISVSDNAPKPGSPDL